VVTTSQVYEAGALSSRGRKPKVSVCMPAHRNSAWFQSAVRSVLAQTETNFEIIVTDDSAGGLQSAVESFADSRLRYYPNPTRLGFSGNHCRAIGLTTGDYVAFLHDDDQWEADYLCRSTEILDRDPAVGLVLCGAIEVDGNGKVLGERPARMDPGLQNDPIAKFTSSGFMMMLPSVSLFRRAALDSNRRPWPDVIAADATMFIDVAQAGWKIHHLAQPLVRYRVHEQQIGTDDLAHRHALVTVWGGYSFADSRLEALRKKSYARFLVARAGAHVKRRNFEAAGKDLREARESDATVVNLRWGVLRAATLLPFFVPALERIRKLVPRRHRHSGV
jgi:glycosyltransferase involved in cell wall biosynthesis